MDFEYELRDEQMNAAVYDLDCPLTMQGHNGCCPGINTKNSNANDKDTKSIDHIKICTLNTRGLNGDTKRLSIMQWIKDGGFDIIGLQETYCTQDFEKQFRKFWPGQIFHSFTDSKHSRGVCILINKGLNAKIESIYTDNLGRKILINIKLNEDIYTVVNIYAPNLDTERKHFLNRTINWVKQHAYSMNNVIIIGDLNSTESPKDRTSERLDGTSRFLKTFKSELGITDSWRKSNPSKLQYTWRDPSFNLNQSRIDYIYISNVLTNFISQSKILIAPMTDHDAVFTELNDLNKKRGPSYWKLNTSLLKDSDYVDGIENVYRETCRDYETSLASDVLWDLLKARFKFFSIEYSKNKAALKRKEIDNIIAKIAEIDQNKKHNQHSEERKVLQEKLNNYYAQKAYGNYIRSRAKWIEEGEVSSKYFLGLEKRRQTYNRIDKLQNNNGKDISTDNEILQECKDFYSNLYSSNSPRKEEIDNFLNGIEFVQKLSDEDRGFCEQQITEDEIINVLKKLKKNKAPGMDGLPVEFYLKFWYIIGKTIQKVFHQAYNQGIMPYTMRASVISLIFKKGERKLLQNYRPISLSNTDYKILAFVLNNRLMQVIGSIVSPDQVGFIKKRFGGQNIRLIEDLLEYTKRFKIEGAIIFLDFRKAFDSLEWTFMIETLNRFNFGPNFTSWIKTLYCKPIAFIKNNGWISEEFLLSRGIRQGCPVSALLFILSIETLSMKIKQSNTYPALKLNINNREVDLRIKQFADDTTLFIKKVDQIGLALSIVDDFSKVSGLGLNRDKTEGILLGDPEIFPAESYGIKWRQSGVKYLGIYVGYDKNFCKQRNWTEKMEKFQRILDNWRKRDLTLFGKVVIVKTLGLSNIVYSARHTETPSEVIKQIESSIFHFLWNKVDRIKRNTLYADLEEGGLNVTDIESYLSAIKCTWMKHLMETPGDTWSAIAYYHINKLGGSEILLNSNFVKSSQNLNMQKIPTFYQQVIIAYNKSKAQSRKNESLSIDVMLKEQVWDNILFVIKDKNNIKTLHFDSWITAGLIKLSDLQFTNGKLNVDYIMRKVQDKRNIYAEIYQVIESLRPYQHILINFNHQPLLNIRNENSPALYKNMLCQNYYKRLVNMKKQVHTLSKWSELLNVEIDETLRIQTFQNKVIAIKEKKLAEFNFKVLHYILSNSYLLSKWNPEFSSSCELCRVDNSICHMLLRCSLAKHVWQQIDLALNLSLSEVEIILGVKNDASLNYIITFISYEIYKFWLRSSIQKENRLIANLFRQIQGDIFSKLKILKILKQKDSHTIESLDKIRACILSQIK